MSKKKEIIKWLIFSFILLGLSILIIKILKEDYIWMDTLLDKMVRNNTLTSIMKFITSFGSAYFLIIVAGVSMLIFKKKNMGNYIALNLAIIYLLNVIIKNIIKRTRPLGYGLLYENGYSFPSGHSMVSVAFYGFILYLVIKNVKNKYFKYISSLIIILLMVLIPISRVYLGVHYPSDVIGGALFSLGYLLLFVMLYNKFCKE